jgi:hypothetical protein
MPVEPLDADTLAQWEHWFATYMPLDAPDMAPLLAVARDHARHTAALEFIKSDSEEMFAVGVATDALRPVTPQPFPWRFSLPASLLPKPKR